MSCYKACNNEEVIINVFFCKNFPNHHILDTSDSHELQNVNINN